MIVMIDNIRYGIRVMTDYPMSSERKFEIAVIHGLPIMSRVVAEQLEYLAVPITAEIAIEIERLQ